MINSEQIKDLRPLKEYELKANIVFYKKELDGTFSTVKLSELEFKRYGKLTARLLRDGKLFTRLNKPFMAFG